MSVKVVRKTLMKLTPGGPRRYFGGPQGLPHFIENKNFRYKFHAKVYLKSLPYQLQKEIERNKII